MLRPTSAHPRTRRAPRIRSRAARREALAGYAFLAPSLVGVALFLVVPIGVVLWLTTQSWDLITPPEFVGLDNIRSVLTDPAFLNSLVVTIVFVLAVVPLQTAIGLLLANLLTKGVRFSTVFRTIIVIPWISAPLALGVVWSWIFAPTGGLLSELVGYRLEILVSPVWALPAVVFVVLWSNVGYTALFFIAGILAIPGELLEAARIDGAGPTATFWRIVFPLLRPTLFFVGITSVISVFNLFDTVYALTAGGPDNRTDVISWRIYHEAFDDWEFGRASVMAVVLFLVLVVITLAQHLFFRRRITYDLS